METVTNLALGDLDVAPEAVDCIVFPAPSATLTNEDLASVEGAAADFAATEILCFEWRGDEIPETGESTLELLGSK